MKSKGLYFFFTLLLGLNFSISSCEARDRGNETENQKQNTYRAGAERMEAYLPLLKGKSVAIVGNHSSRVGDQHLLDTLLALGFEVKRLFSPEHGFRGTEDAGAKVANGIDPKSGLPVISLYGDHKKPRAKEIVDVDVILFDLQDVGVRFYTYLSTLHYVMQAATELEVEVIVLDRQNPNMDKIDGPIMQKESMSFVGLHPVPILYGLSIGEYARMIAGEGWLETEVEPLLTVIECEGLYRNSRIDFKYPPSPNLPNQRSIALYPSLALFEGTVISVGRGTELPFQQIGHPLLKEKYEHSFVPKPSPGATDPKLKGEACYGLLLDEVNTDSLGFDLSYLLDLYTNFPDKANFFNSYFHLLAGNKELRDQIEAGKAESEIRAAWVKDLKSFRKLRNRYLIYGYP